MESGTRFVYLAVHFSISLKIQRVQLTEQKTVLSGLIESFHNGFSIQQIPRGISLSLSLWFCFTLLLKWVFHYTGSTKMSQIYDCYWTNLSWVFVLFANPDQY